METLTELECWGSVYGADTTLFPITISVMKTVADLKKVIVKDCLPNTFRDVDASVLHLYSTTLPDDPDLDSVVIGQWTMEDKPRLEPLQILSKLNLSSSSLIIVLAPNRARLIWYCVTLLTTLNQTPRVRPTCTSTAGCAARTSHTHFLSKFRAG